MPAESLPRILVVDDDEDTRQLIAFALGKSRYAITEAADGEAALAALRAGRFDLVITDYDMPGVTGAEMLKRATREGILGQASSLVVTAHPDPRGVPEETPLLSKPLDLERLLVQVRMILPDRAAGTGVGRRRAARPRRRRARARPRPLRQPALPRLAQGAPPHG